MKYAIVLFTLLFSSIALAWNISTEIKLKNTLIIMTIKNDAPVSVDCTGELFGVLSNNKKVSQRYSEHISSNSEVNVTLSHSSLKFKDGWATINCE